MRQTRFLSCFFVCFDLFGRVFFLNLLGCTWFLPRRTGLRRCVGSSAVVLGDFTEVELVKYTFTGNADCCLAGSAELKCGRLALA